MFKRAYPLFISCVLVLAVPASAQLRFIVRPTTPGGITAVAQRHALAVVQLLDTVGLVYLVTSSNGRTIQQVETEVGKDVEVVDIEQDQNTAVPEVSQTTAAILDNLPTPTAVTYYSAPVLGVYLSQKAVSVIHLPDAQSAFATTGAGIVAIIDTGIDPTHPVLRGSVVPGYDFVHNIPGGSEWIDLTPKNYQVLTHSSPIITSKNTVAMVSPSTAAILDQTTAAILDYKNMPRAFGHGTMVAGVVHLAAPTAQIMPLKAFKGDGSATLVDILRAIYYAADHGAHVINMSFNLTIASTELANAMQYATDKNVICVASSGNTGKGVVGNPASLDYVVGVASTTNLDKRSKFSSYGTGVWVAAPGEGVVTTYPGQNYAEATGTSFSAPLVSGTAALTVQVNNQTDYGKSSTALSYAKQLPGLGLGNGRLDVFQTIQFMIQNP